MNINEIATRHYEWVEQMGWHNATVLEALALIASEIGEAAEEAFDHPYTKLGEELADFVLRTADLARRMNVDLANLVENTQVTWRSESLLEDFAEVMVEMGKWVNTARRAVLDETFGIAMARTFCRVQQIAARNNIDLEKEVLRKMEINAKNGTRGRII
jgi:NTP pyrophosphatase (non-canonical NTP hydrolase)